MGSTKCYDVLMPQAKDTKFKPSVEPGQEDTELKGKVQKEKDKYDAQAEAIYDAEVGLMEAKYEAERLKIKASKPQLISQFMQERFNSTDIEKYGETGIKTTLAKEYEILVNNKKYEEKIKDNNKEVIEKRGEKSEEKIDKEKADKKEDLKETHNKKNNNRKAKRAAEESPDLIAYASQLGKDTDKQIDNAGEIFDKLLEDYKRTVEETCKEIGERDGAIAVGVYNKVIKDTAKTAYDATQKVIAKAEVVKQKAIQTVKLKLMGIIGM